MEEKNSRRKFIEKTAAGMAATALITTGCGEMDKELGKNFVHHVFFWFKQPVTDEMKSRFEKALRELVTIETITDFHLGIPAETSRDVIDSSYAYSLLTVFKNKEGQDIYQSHPKHLKFIDDCQDLWEKVLVYDSVSI
jgi:hypothetical protein